MPIYFGPGLPDADHRFPEIKDDVALVRDGIIQILGTKKGSRLFLPQFGCNLQSMLFEPNDLALQTFIEQDVTQAINTWEPRVKLLGVRVIANENSVSINLSLLLKKVNIPFNLPLLIDRIPTNTI